MENSILKDKTYLSENQEFHEIQELDEEKVTYSLAEYDEVSKSALDAFGIKYLFPWQRIVISNILDSAQQSELPRQDNETENDIICNGKRKVESLKLFLIPETSRADKQKNKETLVIPLMLK